RAHVSRGAQPDDDPGRHRPERDPGPGRGHAQLPLRAEQVAPAGGGLPARAGRARPEDPVELAAGARRSAVDACPAAALDRGVRPRGEAGLDAGGRVRGARTRRDQPRARRDAVRAQGGRAGRGRRAQPHARRAPAFRLDSVSRLMRLSPVLAEMATYPFVRLEEAKRAVAARGIELIDFGVGDPREATDPAIRQALVDAVSERLGYPLAVGLPELREAIAAWVERRFGTRLDPNREVIPTLGSKEAIF